VAAASAKLADEPAKDIEARRRSRSASISDDLELLTWTLESGWLRQQTTKRAASTQPDTLSHSNEAVTPVIEPADAFPSPQAAQADGQLLRATAYIAIVIGAALILSGLIGISIANHKLSNRNALSLAGRSIPAQDLHFSSSEKLSNGQSPRPKRSIELLNNNLVSLEREFALQFREFESAKEFIPVAPRLSTPKPVTILPSQRV
jgi:hypothetical protein